MHSLIFKMFQKSLNWIFFFFRIFLSFLLTMIMCIEMCHVFQSWIYSWDAARVFFGNSKHKIQHNIFNIYIFFSLHTFFYKRIVFTHSYLTVCVRTLRDARYKTTIRKASMSEMAEVLLSLSKQLREPIE